MSTALELHADLQVELDLPGRGQVQAHLRGDGKQLDLEVDDPGAFAGRGDVSAVNEVAERLADHGISVRVLSNKIHLITIGAARVPWWQRRLTGSRHIRLGSLRGLVTSARARTTAGDLPVLPDRALAPPPAVSPLSTFFRRPRHITTTHSSRGGGDPKLVLAPREDWPGGRRPFFRLGRETTTIGSSETAHIRLPGLAPLHAEVWLTEDDEYILVSRHPDTRVHGERVARQMLRTAARVDLGEWTMTFYRDEHADHGRPFGGRVGGEIGHQRPQPPRQRTSTTTESS